MRHSSRSHASGENAEYTPMMSAAGARKRVAWQDRVYKEHLGRKRPLVLDFLGRKIVVYRNVFAPVPYDFNLLAKTVLREVKGTDSVLDMGTGSGIQAILAASKSKRVLAVDVNPDAVRCPMRNVGMNGLTGCIKVMQSDLYEGQGTLQLDNVRSAISLDSSAGLVGSTDPRGKAANLISQTGLSCNFAKRRKTIPIETMS